MHILMRCPCGANLKAPAKFVGKELKCPKCSTMLIVPAPPTATPSQPVEPGLELLDSPEWDPLQPLPGSQPLVPPIQRPIQRQAPKKKSNKPSRDVSWPIIAAIVAVALLLFGGVLFFVYAQQSSTLSSKRGGVRSKGRQINMDDLRERARQVQSTPAPPAKVAIINTFDTGSMVFNNPSVQGSDTDLSMTDLIERVEPSIVRIKVLSRDGSEGIGSGCFIDDEGKIVTNYHVVASAVQVTVSTADGKQTESPGFVSKVRGKDIAIIQIDPTELNVVPIPIATEVPAKGEKIAAFGAPQGFNFSATEGIVSGLRTGQEIHDTLQEMNRTGEYTGKGYDVETNWIQSSAAISGGNSGGPLVNMKGEMVGVNTWTHSGGQNLNFATTVAEVGDVFMSRENKLQPYHNLMFGAQTRN